jgi:Polysaccharide biosynthesis/export protein
MLIKRISYLLRRINLFVFAYLTLTALQSSLGGENEFPDEVLNRFVQKIKEQAEQITKQTVQINTQAEKIKTLEALLKLKEPKIDGVVSNRLVNNTEFIFKPRTIYIGNELKIKITAKTSKISTFIVQPNGQINIPGIGNLSASGKTTEEFQLEIEKLLIKPDKPKFNPVVLVEIVNFSK